MSGPQQKRSRANTAGDDGNATPPTTKLWTALEPPLITCFLHEALVKWKRERELYEAAVIARWQESGESVTAVMRPTITTIHRRLLKTFCELELKTSVSVMTNDKLLTVVEQILAIMMNDQIVTMQPEIQVASAAALPGEPEPGIWNVMTFSVGGERRILRENPNFRLPEPSDRTPLFQEGDAWRGPKRWPILSDRPVEIEGLTFDANWRPGVPGRWTS
ncbi:hypothetical protein PHMEG_00039616 [Phytophthora megakarya]|uniref:Uncharacterized protein n=1 Tax=Phytophthora megakarya TaxID=4795 RepID=A0A225UFJ2_9STRA|nr:hypothetical protein PHMEG_00039616 [Phytophthora megakarya]